MEEQYMVGFYEEVSPGVTQPVFEHPCNTPTSLEKAQEFQKLLNGLSTSRYRIFKVTISEVESGQ
jgi:hypothetical protein